MKVNMAGGERVMGKVLGDKVRAVARGLMRSCLIAIIGFGLLLLVMWERVKVFEWWIACSDLCGWYVECRLKQGDRVGGYSNHGRGEVACTRCLQ